MASAGISSDISQRGDTKNPQGHNVSSLMGRSVTLIPCGHIIDEDRLIQALVHDRLCPLDQQPIEGHIRIKHLPEEVATGDPRVSFADTSKERYTDFLVRLLQKPAIQSDSSLKTLLNQELDGLMVQKQAELSTEQLESYSWAQRVLVDGEVSQVVSNNLQRLHLERGSKEDYYTLGGYYISGNAIVDRDEVKGAVWFKKAAEQGHRDAQYRLARCYSLGRGVEKNEEEARKWFKIYANGGDSIDRFKLGERFAEGREVTQDMKAALDFFRLAADEGYEPAQFQLAKCYDQGLGIEKNRAEAVKWYRKAAQQGNIFAQLTLGNYLGYGRGVEKNEDEALKWYKEAAAQGTTRNRCRFANRCAEGRGVAKNEVEALKWYRIAAEEGNQEAQFNLAQSYEFGFGGQAKDIAKATKWYRIASEQGHIEAKRQQAKLESWWWYLFGDWLYS